MCNQKLIGARYFNAGLGRRRRRSRRTGRGSSCRRATTTVTARTPRRPPAATTASPATAPPRSFGTVSGMAPRARIASYKALWSTQDASTASGHDRRPRRRDRPGRGRRRRRDQLLDQRVRTTNFLDPVEIAFLFAADAGVFVAASAGNSGPTDQHGRAPEPVDDDGRRRARTTATAAARSRSATASTYTGASVGDRRRPGAADRLDGGRPCRRRSRQGRAVLRRCDNGGRCPRPGEGRRQDRRLRPRRQRPRQQEPRGPAGGRRRDDPRQPDRRQLAERRLPLRADGAPRRRTARAIKAYAATAGATATINAATIVFDAPAPFTAAFSSRGPLLAGGGDLLKPDVIAPGQDILAAVAPPGQRRP